jgi:hypothetical protein
MFPFILYSPHIALGSIWIKTALQSLYVTTHPFRVVVSLAFCAVELTMDSGTSIAYLKIMDPSSS